MLEAHSAPAKQGLSRTRLGCLLFPRGGSPPRLLFIRFPDGDAVPLLQVLAQGLLALSWGCRREPKPAGAGHNQLHTSLLGRRALGKLRV